MPRSGDWGFGLAARRSLPKSSVFKSTVVAPPEEPPPPGYTPAAQFNDLRNSQYVALLFEDF